jgi:hypothetical protein
MLVNPYPYSNRIAAIIFGPKNVVILVGSNEIVPGVKTAMFRIKNYAAPVITESILLLAFVRAL